MSNKKSNRTRNWIIVGAVAVAGVFGYRYWQSMLTAMPDGIAFGNGRLEAKLVDIAAREPLRVKEILVEEGALVKPGDVLVKLDTVSLDAELAQANQSVAAAQQRLAVARANIVKQKSEISLASIEAGRSKKLVDQGAGSQRELDVRTTQLETSNASLAEAEAGLKTAEQQVEVAKAAAATVQTRITDATLTSPVTGRVLYRLAEPGEVIAAGGKALTLVNLEDVYMEIFLPSEDAAALKLNAEARIVPDFDTTRSIPGFVTFVAPESQFTPKQVETKNERDKLMFRVKIQVPKELVSNYVERVKTGIRGVGYVKVNPSVEWPASLQNVVAPQPASASAQ
jgi:HlyD family secretion protein